MSTAINDANGWFFLDDELLSEGLVSDMFPEDDILDELLLDDDDEVMWLQHSFAQTPRKDKWKKYNRLDWDLHVEKLFHEDLFEETYRMNVQSFYKLVNLLGDDIVVDPDKSANSTGGTYQPTLPEVFAGCGLRYLGENDSLKAISDIFDHSKSTTKRCINQFIDAVNNCKALEPKLPTTEPELRKLAAGFASKSRAGDLMYGVIGAIDGWLCTINCPQGIPDPSKYHSGHYQRYGINVQAVSDSEGRLYYVALAAPGRTNDARAFDKCTTLRQWLDQLPDAYFLLGDNAYPLSDDLLIPFSGSLRDLPLNDAYNFYLSQLRIRVEQAFGFLTNKWRIFRKNLEHDLPNIRRVLECCIRLHNYCIDERQILTDERGNNINRGPNEHYKYRETAAQDDTTSVPMQQGTARRSVLVEQLGSIGLERPAYNLERNTITNRIERTTIPNQAAM